MLSWRPLAVLLLLIPFSARPEAYFFDYTPRCAAAYGQYTALRLNAGDRTITDEFIANPHNLMATYLADYSDFLLLLFNGNEASWNQRSEHQDERIGLLDRADNNQPWKRLCKSGIYLHWAVLHALRGENLKAALLFRKSYGLMKDNEKRFPRFAPNNVFLGAEEAIIATIPDDYKWLAGIFGLKGNLRQGEGRIATYLRAHPGAIEPLREEALIYDYYIRFYLLSQAADVGRSVSSEPEFAATNNLMRLFVRANLALNNRRADIALEAMQEAQKLPGYHDFPVFDYELGQALQLRLDGSCTVYLRSFTGRSPDGLFCKDGWQKLAFALYLQGDYAAATAARQSIRLHGSLFTDADKQAERFATGGAWPDALLLKARLLTDGGYYNPALTLLNNAGEQHFTSTAAKAEYCFRLGRALDESGNSVAALAAYDRAVLLGRAQQEQFGARAALQAGLISERQGRKEAAMRYFKDCLSMRDHDFQSSIDQQAKAGLARLSAG